MGPGCRKDSNDKVYTCEGIVASYIQGNLVKTSISSAALAIVQLALAICGCVVRYPKCFAYCDVCKKKKSEKDATWTDVQNSLRLCHFFKVVQLVFAYDVQYCFISFHSFTFV